MNEEELLSLLPLKRTWLDDIVDVLIKRPHGEGEVAAIVIALSKTSRDLGAEAESTITRTINNFCVNSGDSENVERFPIFESIGSAKYRLLGFPGRPDLIEIQQVQFLEDAYRHTWDLFVEKAKEQMPGWEAMSKRQRLVAFSRKLRESEALRAYLENRRPPTITL